MCHSNTSQVKKCESCNFETILPEMMTVHIGNDHTEKLEKCSYCEFRAEDEEKINVHVMNKHDECNNYPCEECVFKTTSAKELMKHIEGNHKQASLVCSYCEFLPKNENELKIHVNTQHEDSAMITIV